MKFWHTVLVAGIVGAVALNVISLVIGATYSNLWGGIGPTLNYTNAVILGFLVGASVQMILRYLKVS